MDVGQPGSTVHWWHGNPVIWYAGSPVVWYAGSPVVWYAGRPEVWKSGDLGVKRGGSVVDAGEEEGVAGDGLAGEGPERGPVRRRAEPLRDGNCILGRSGR